MAHHCLSHMDNPLRRKLCVHNMLAVAEAFLHNRHSFGCFRMEKVGWIFTQSSKERDYIMNSEEISQMAAWQDEVGEHCVTGVVSLAVSDEGSDVHFEAFQVRICQKNTCKV